MNPVLLTDAGNPQNQNRGLIIHDCPRVVFCVADGDGGLAGIAHGIKSIPDDWIGQMARREEVDSLFMKFAMLCKNGVGNVG